MKRHRSLVLCRLVPFFLIACAVDPSGTAEKATDTTLVLVREKKLAKIAGVGQALEASGVTVKDGRLTLVADDVSQLVSVDVDLSTGSGLSGKDGGSQYEGVTTDGARFFVAVEGAPSYVVEMDERGTILSRLPVGLDFLDANKALEGIAWIGDATADRLLALPERGGQVSVLTRASDRWTVTVTLPRPPKADFSDYADVAVRPRGEGSYDVAILSQESSAIWVGRLTQGPWQLVGPGTRYDFPQDPSGTLRYCTVEGVAFIDERTLAFVSDKADESDGACGDEDQSVHVFALP